MAKQDGIAPLSGTLGNLTFYSMDGKWYARRKSSLDKKRVLRDPRFAGSRQSSQRLAGGSKIGSTIYREYFPGIKSFAKFNQLTGEATRLLKEGYSKEDVLRKMRKKYKPVHATPAVKKKGALKKASGNKKKGNGSKKNKAGK